MKPWMHFLGHHFLPPDIFPPWPKLWGCFPCLSRDCGTQKNTGVAICQGLVRQGEVNSSNHPSTLVLRLMFDFYWLLNGFMLPSLCEHLQFIFLLFRLWTWKFLLLTQTIRYLSVTFGLTCKIELRSKIKLLNWWIRQDNWSEKLNLKEIYCFNYFKWINQCVKINIRQKNMQC